MTSDRDAIRFAFAGDRDIAVWVLDFMLGRSQRPLALLLPRGASHGIELRRLCSQLDPGHIVIGPAFREQEGMRILRDLDLDYIFCVHFPYLIPKGVLEIPRVGVLNLHPAPLPFNRGWHTTSWPILEGTPSGATLHFMNEQLDAGDVVHQRTLEVAADDTADSLYRRVKRLELEVFREAFPSLLERSPAHSPQDIQSGTFHSREELSRPEVREIHADQLTPAGELIDRLRALTTDRLEEAAILIRDGQRLRVQVRIVPEGDSEGQETR